MNEAKQDQNTDRNGEEYETRLRQARMKEARLTRILEQLPRAALAFSGGVDSAYLLYAARQAAMDIQAYFIQSPFQTREERRQAENFCRHLGMRLEILSLAILEDEAVRANTSRRCYDCKRRILLRLTEAALRDGRELLLSGDHAGDLKEDRPGRQALLEFSVRSPLAEAGLVKEEIRILAREAGLEVWDRPSMACLATRIATGTCIENHDLRLLERAEAELRKLGFRQFRLRLRARGFVFEGTEEEQERFFRERREISELLAATRGEGDRADRFLAMDMKARDDEFSCLDKRGTGHADV